MKGYKGFNAKLQCTPSGKVFQYEIGTTYTEPTANLCDKGFHFCESPLDIFNYYKLNDGSRYTEVEADGVTDQEKEDSKRACTSLTIGAEIKITALIKAAIRFVFDRVTSTTGNFAHSATTGNFAESSVSGKNAIAASLGVKGKAKGVKGDWLVLAEYRDDGSIKAIGVAHIGGKKIKPDTFYTLKDGKFTEAGQ
jgi:hypothetical protein